jgi:FkbM family methyltransferase
MNIIKMAIKKTAGKAFSKMAGKNKCQPFFERLYSEALTGMNIGSGGNYLASGEKCIVKHIAQKHKNLKTIIVFDVGANVGNYSKMAADVLGDNACLYAFEPSKATFQRLEENTKLIKNITRYNFGFSDMDTEITLYSDKESSGLASVYKRNLEHFSINMGNTETIEVKTIDAFCMENKIDSIDFLKMDVEGNELKVLHGAKNLINNGGIESLQFEFGGCNIDSRTYFQDFYYLLKDRYKIYRIVQDGLFEIKQYREIYECFITTNFFAEKL